MPVVSITTRSNLSLPSTRFSFSEPRMRMRSPRTVQQMQPLFISTICSSLFSTMSAAAQTPFGIVHELAGDVTLNDVPLTRQRALQSGQTIRTGGDGRVWFSIGSDAYFLRANSRLRLEASKPREAIVDFLRLVTGALGATFQRGTRRTLIAPTATIGIRGTGVYLEATPDVSYFCTCFGSTEILTAPSGSMMDSVTVAAENHLARRIHREAMSGMRIVPAGFERHTNEEMARLESLADRPNPFRS